MAFEEKPNTGVLFPNNRKEKDSHPDYRGKANYKGIEFEIAGWKKTSQNGQPRISLSLKEPYRKPEAVSDLGGDWA